MSFIVLCVDSWYGIVVRSDKPDHCPFIGTVPCHPDDAKTDREFTTRAAHIAVCLGGWISKMKSSHADVKHFIVVSDRQSHPVLADREVQLWRESLEKDSRLAGLRVDVRAATELRHKLEAASMSPPVRADNPSSTPPLASFLARNAEAAGLLSRNRVCIVAGAEGVNIGNVSSEQGADVPQSPCMLPDTFETWIIATDVEIRSGGSILIGNADLQ